ncbi:MAG: hypothetical protein Q9195_002775 [Heterodermia aff. obscurata]
MNSMSRSFKRDSGGRPTRYRTPSPPRDAFETLSPIGGPQNSLHWPNCNLWNNTRSRTHEHQRRPFKETIAIDGQLERSAKRARSEKLPSPELRRSSEVKPARPATSYGQSPENRMHEAELLLNFAQEARFAVPRRPERQRTEESFSPEFAASRNTVITMAREQEGKIESRSASGRSPTDGMCVDSVNDNLQKEPTEDHESSAASKANKLPAYIYPSVQQPPVPKIPVNSTILDAVQKPPEYPNSIYETESEFLETAQTHDIMNQSIDSHATDIAESNAEVSYGEVPVEVSAAPSTDKQLKIKASLIDGTVVAEEVHRQSYETGSENRNLSRVNNILSMNFDSRSRSNTRIKASDSETLQQTIPAPITRLPPKLDSPVGTVEADIRSEKSSFTDDAELISSQAILQAMCAACNFTRSTVDGETDNNSTSWISCDACKSWFHFACAGFKNEREVRGVDKFRCRKCKPIHGSTTFVRKSARAHSAIDYAGLHQGVIKTSDETPEHHYIKPIKEGTITFLPETFARIRPELVTAEYFEKGYGWKEPIVVPAAWNPRDQIGHTQPLPKSSRMEQKPNADASSPGSASEEWGFADPESEFVPDHGQDALDMVMPKGLTVRAVAELYGQEEKVEVIDVKSQNGEGKKWNMRRWVDYYENKSNKTVRNVISLEVSQSKLGRLIRRPQIVRDLDLQDSVWPAELQSKGEIPRVQFYCLMSVADCFTDFHIDFGGSSVFYHILKGKKTFFFIPPKEKHLKKYEEWCLSPAQNWTFLGEQTKECYRVDLLEGDTMFIPAGWIHAVWTPEDSLVIGGNFLTRLNFGMQLRISQIEKATGVARKFRYPHFQKIHWYTAFRYMEDDALPDIVLKLLQEGEIFYREQPAHHEFDDWGENSKSGLGNYHARYYSQAELEGLPDLCRYLLRTALIDLGSISDGITQETRNAVKRSIPRGHGEPLEVVKKFAAWCAWKRGNEAIPAWAYPHVMPEPESAGASKLAKKLDLNRESALTGPRRQSARQSQSKATPDQSGSTPTAMPARPETPTEGKPPVGAMALPDVHPPAARKGRAISGTASTSHRKVACESCRKRRRACKHKDLKDVLYPDTPPTNLVDVVPPISASRMDALTDLANNANDNSEEDNVQPDISTRDALAETEVGTARPQPGAFHPDEHRTVETDDSNYLLKTPDEIASTPKMLTHLSGAGLLRLEHRIAGGPVNGLSVLSLNAPHSRGRTKACSDCRKSKRRCIHDEYGNQDPVKAREAAIPRPAANKRRKTDSDGNEDSLVKKPRMSSGTAPPPTVQESRDFQIPSGEPSPQAPTANMLMAATAVMMKPSLTSEAQHSGQDDMMLSALDQIQAAADSMSHVHSRTLELHPRAIAANPPALSTEPGTLFPTQLPQDILGQAPEDLQNPIHSNSSPTISVKRNFPIDPALEHMSSAFSVPVASLVSPPASSHADASRTPPSPSAISSRHSSRHPKQMQRYTPESGPRRDSSSSSVDELSTTKDGRRANSAASEVMETSPMTTISATGDDERRGEVQNSHPHEDEPKGEPTGRKSKGSMDGMADEESLRLIKELQAQDYGLRRRGKA